MPIGAGNYDKECMDALKATSARSCLLIVTGGKHGPGFSFIGDIRDTLRVPELLRKTADLIEADMSAHARDTGA